MPFGRIISALLGRSIESKDGYDANLIPGGVSVPEPELELRTAGKPGGGPRPGGGPKGLPAKLRVLVCEWPDPSEDVRDGPIGKVIRFRRKLYQVSIQTFYYSLRRWAWF